MTDEFEDNCTKTLDIESVWESIAHFWTLMIRSGDATRSKMIYPALLELMGSISDRRIVDVGCGEGQFCRLLASQRAKVTGIDVSPSMIDYAKTYASKEKLDTEFLLLDAVELSKVFVEPADSITMIMFLMCVEDVSKILLECSRILRTDGHLYIVILHPCFINASMLSATNLIAEQKDAHCYLSQYSYYMDLLDEPEIPVFHRPLCDYTQWLMDSGFYIQRITELPSGNNLCGSTQILSPSYLIFDCVKN